MYYVRTLNLHRTLCILNLYTNKKYYSLNLHWTKYFPNPPVSVA